MTLCEEINGCANFIYFKVLFMQKGAEKALFERICACPSDEKRTPRESVRASYALPRLLLFSLKSLPLITKCMLLLSCERQLLSGESFLPRGQCLLLSYE